MTTRGNSSPLLLCIVITFTASAAGLKAFFSDDSIRLCVGTAKADNPLTRFRAKYFEWHATHISRHDTPSA